MKRIFAAFCFCALLLLVSGCASAKKLYDLKNANLSAPVQNTVRICNTLTWIYNTCEDYDDMNEMLAEIGITRQDLESFQFKGTYEKPFARQFAAAPTYSDEPDVYGSARKQARKVARLILKNLPPEQSGQSDE